ncbi:MAG: hypothetical protein AABY22_13280 [Nanoarchaeota archaeon]
MAKKNKLLGWLLWVVSLLTTLGLGGLFLNGTIAGTFLSFLPLIIHQIAGWVIVITALWGAIQELL